MDGNKPKAAMPRIAAIVAVAVLFGANTAGHAEQQIAPAPMAQATADPHAAVFVPSEEAAFEESFRAFDEPVEPVIPEHAVDITEIEPAEPAAIRSLGRGVASYYGSRFHGRRTANGESFDMNALTAAHRTLPFGSRVRVTNPNTGRSVIVRINDRGPHVRGREIDLSRAAAEEVGIVRAGHGSVEMELLDS